MKRIVDISFAGCGFLAMYHVGVLKYVQNEANHLVRIDRALGASSGSVIACLALIQYPAMDIREKFREITRRARRNYVGAFSPNFEISEIFKEILEPEIPETILDTVNGRLFISLRSQAGPTG